MSIKTQKIIRFIPIVNLVTMFCWMFLQYKSSYSVESFIKHLLVMAAAVIACVFPRVIATTLNADPVVYDVILYTFLYIQTLCMAFVAVHAQEKIYEHIGQNENQNS